MDLKSLSDELPRAAVHWRVQGKPYKGRDGFAAMALAYIDARAVMDRLDAVCGPENWQAEYTETASGRVLCKIGIRCGDEWVWKSDGAGSTQVEGEKGGISDALKRAAVAWGIGRYLYRLDSPWVSCEVNEKNGNTYWKRWTEDPWSKVKVVGYTAPTPKEEPSQEADTAKRNPVEVATALVDIVNKAQNDGVLSARLKSAKFSEAWQWLDDEHPDEALKVRRAVDAAQMKFAAPEAAE